jgi:4'-phosphopantetheinyl transferase
MAVDVRWHRSSGDTDAALAGHVLEVLGDGQVTVGRVCPSCGSTGHGRPWARHDRRDVHVSLSRSGPHLLTAVSPQEPVGVDVESVADVSSHWDANVVLAAAEVADSDQDRARTWAAKEAVLKVYGVGLARQMSDLPLAGFDGELVDVPAPDGFVAVVASRQDAGSSVWKSQASNSAESD